MRKLIFDNSAKGIQVDYGQFDALQQQNLQTVEGIVKVLFPAYTAGDLAVLFGCEVTDNGDGTWTTTAGKIYKDGEIYDVDAATVAIADTPLWKLDATIETAKFGDGNTYNIREVKKIALADGATGTELGNVGSEKTPLRKKVVEIGDWDMNTNTLKDVDLSSIFSANVLQKIKSASVIIRSDGDAVLSFTDLINYRDDNGYRGWFNLTINSTTVKISIHHDLNSFFKTSTEYNKTNYNRGWVTIEYGDY